MKRKQKCTVYGKQFDIHDTYANLHFVKQMGYSERREALENAGLNPDDYEV